MPFETDVNNTVGHDKNKPGTYQSFKKSDHWLTQPNTFQAILKYIPKDTKIWMPFYYDGSCQKILNDLGYDNVIHRDEDFYTYQPNDWDMVIDNPPYSNKSQVIERLISLGKPFALVLPINTLVTRYAHRNFKNKHISLIILDNRKHHFLKSGDPPRTNHNGSPTNPIMPCWFCYNIDLPNRIIFED